MQLTQRLRNFSERFDHVYVRRSATWRTPNYVGFAHYSGWSGLRLAIAVGLPAIAGIGWLLLGPSRAWGVALIVVWLGVIAWLVVLQVGAPSGKLTNPDLSEFALSAARALGISTEFETWRIRGPQAERFGTELHRLNTGLAALRVPSDVPRAQVERDWLAAQVAPEFARYLPNAALKGPGTEPSAVEIDSFTAGDPWPTLENRNREWPTLAGSDEPGDTHS